MINDVLMNTSLAGVLEIVGDKHRFFRTYGGCLIESCPPRTKYTFIRRDTRHLEVIVVDRMGTFITDKAVVDPLTSGWGK